MCAMNWPSYADLAEELLRLVLHRGGTAHEVPASSVYEPLATQFSLSEYQRAAARDDGHPGRAWPIRVQWTRQRLINHGLIVGCHDPQWRRGNWKLTPAGVERAQSLNNS